MLAAHIFERVRKPIFLLREIFPSLFWKIRQKPLFNKKLFFVVVIKHDLFELKCMLKVTMAKLGATTETNRQRQLQLVISASTCNGA